MATKLTIPTEVDVDKSSLLNKVPLVLLGLGLVMLTYLSTLFHLDPSRTMFSYLFAFTVVLSLSLGSLGFVMIQHLTRAGWSVVLRRIPETAVGILPLFILLFIPIALFAHDIFPWLHADHLDEVLSRKVDYLNEPFFLLRAAIYFVTWSVLGLWFYLTSLAQDGGGKYKYTSWMQAVSAPGIVMYGFTLTFASIDWIMSLQPHWYSTIFGVYFFAGCLLSALSFMTLMAMVLQSAGLLPKAITGEHYHDLGKLNFGFTIFWAYIGFSQFMLYWYANIPEEIEFYTHRMHHGWGIISWSLPFIHFVVPFLALLSRALKRVKTILAVNCLWIIMVHMVDLYWVIMPAYRDAEGQSHLHITLSDGLALFGLILVFLGVYLTLLSRKKVAPVGDPRLAESLAFENI